MKNLILPNVRHKDGYLISALEQYIDHWDGRCNFRDTDREMNEVLKAHIEKTLKWDNVRPGPKLADLSKTIQAIEAMMPKIRDTNDLFKIEAAEKLTSILRGLGDQAKRDLEAAFWNELHDALTTMGYKVTPVNLSPDSILRSYHEGGWVDIGLKILFEVEGAKHPFHFLVIASKGACYYGFLFMSENGSGKPEQSKGSRTPLSKMAEECSAEAMQGCKIWTWPSWYGCAVDKSFWFRGMYMKDVAERLGDANRPLLVKNLAGRFDGYIKKFIASAGKRGLKL